MPHELQCGFILRRECVSPSRVHPPPGPRTHVYLERRDARTQGRRHRTALRTGPPGDEGRAGPHACIAKP